MDTREIPLTQGKVAIVDAADYEYLSQWRWHAHKGRNTFYAERSSPRVNGKQGMILMHALLAGKGCDHIDGNGLNNSRANLRPASPQQNSFNRGLRSDNTSGMKGVTWSNRDNKWRARIAVNGKSKHLGYFTNAEDAARAYDTAARELHGDFARPNDAISEAQAAKLGKVKNVA